MSDDEWGMLMEKLVQFGTRLRDAKQRRMSDFVTVEKKQ